MINFFVKPILDGWVYPCTIEDVQSQLEHIPPDDLKGLWAIGLAPSTKKDCSANGCYIKGDKPTIYLYSYSATLSYRLPAHTRKSDVEYSQAIELEYGMVVREEGSRLVCQWQSNYLRRFILEHVLIHEIGHHVLQMKRKREGLNKKASIQVSEQFADDYAVRWQRSMGFIKY